MVAGKLSEAALSSKSSLRSHIASFDVWVWPMSSDSQDDRAVLFCRFDNQLIAPLPILKMYPAVDRLVCVHPAQSALVQPISSSIGPL